MSFKNINTCLHRLLLHCGLISLVLIAVLPKSALSTALSDEFNNSNDVLLDNPPRTSANILLSPLVFHWQIYLAINQDLISAGIQTKKAAEDHWVNAGAREGRRAMGGFHSKVYLELNQDLARKFGKKNYLEAVKHYINSGQREGRPGIRKDSTFGGTYPGGYGNSMLGNEFFFVGTTARVAGAIGSIVYGGKEFINSFDHGRELQIAFQKFGMGECNNPTEAGSGDDGVGPGTTSQLTNIKALPSGTLQTRVIPAHWVQPGKTSPYCPKKLTRPSTTPRADDNPISKKLQIGFNGNRQIIVYDFTIEFKKPMSILDLEAPTGYLTHEFTHFYEVNTQDGKLRRMYPERTSIGFMGGSTSFPEILSTPDGRHAMGVFSPPHYGANPLYVYFQFMGTGRKETDANKWTIYYHMDEVQAGSLSYRTFIVVGSLKQVKNSLFQLSKMSPVELLQ